MGKGGNGRGKDDRESKYVKKVDHYKFIMKWALRSYANVDGQILFTNGCKASKHFTEETLRDMIDGENSELVRRLGMGVSLASGKI